MPQVLPEEVLVVMFGSHVRVQLLRWMANNVDERVPISYLAGKLRARAQTYLRLLRPLRDAGMLSHDPGYHWVVEPHPMWAPLREMLGPVHS